MAPAKSRDSVATRDAILAAARGQFAAGSYETVKLRDVAREAGIDVALISRYFGSKEELFCKVLLERPGEQWFGGRSDLDGLADWLADLAAGPGGDHEDIERLSIILRSASSAATASIVQNAFVYSVFAPLAGLLSTEEGEARASLALSIVIGATVIRGIVNAPPRTERQQSAERDRLRYLICKALSY